MRIRRNSSCLKVPQGTTCLSGAMSLLRNLSHHPCLRVDSDSLFSMSLTAPSSSASAEAAAIAVAAAAAATAAAASTVAAIAIATAAHHNVD